MGDYFAVRFRAKLKDGGIKTVEEFESYAYERDLALQLDTAPLRHYGHEPSFGSDLVYSETSFFDINGVSITDSTLSLCANGFNLFRPHFEEHDGIQPSPDFTRLDAVMQAFSDITVGVEGEIHGVIGSEHHDNPKWLIPFAQVHTKCCHFC